MKNFIRNNCVLLWILIFFILIRLCNFSRVMRYESSTEILQIFQFITVKGQVFHLIPHFPLAVILYKIGALIIGNTILGVKVMHFFLNLSTFFLVYKTALLFYNDKKVANWSVLLYTISFYAYAGNTMGIDQDLAINPFLFILTLYLYKRYSDFSLKGILLIVLACGLLTISRPILGVIVMGIIFIDMILNYFVENKKEIKFSGIVKSVLKYLKLFIPYLVVGRLLCYLMYKIFPSPVIKALNTYKNLFLGSTGSGGVSLLTRISFLGQVFLYTSPLILSIVFLFKNFKKHQLIVISTVVMILYMFMGTSGGDPARWMMPVLPILLIGWGYLCGEYINKRNIIWIIITVAIIVVGNTILLDYIDLPANITDYMSNIFNRIFLLQSTIFNPIFLDTKLVFGIAGVSFLFFISFIISSDQKVRELFFIFSLGVNVAFICIHLFQIKQPNISSIGKQMYEYCAVNCDLNQKIYSDQVSKDTIMLGLREKNVGSYFKFDPDSKVVENSDNLLNIITNLTGVNLFTECLEQGDIINIISENGPGFVFLTHYFDYDNVEKLLYEYCSLEKKFYGNNKFIYGIVYMCDL